LCDIWFSFEPFQTTRRQRMRSHPVRCSLISRFE
jgi:hypothetical protein